MGSFVTDTHSEFAELLEAIQSLGARKKSLETRLQAIEERRSTTAPAIYEKVRRETEDSLLELVADQARYRDRAVTLHDRLSSERAALEQKLEQLTQELEELRFRKTLGEYSDDEFAKIERERSEIITNTRATLQPFEEMSSVLDPFLESTSRSSPSAPPPAPALPAPSPGSPPPPIREISEMESLFGSGGGTAPPPAHERGKLREIETPALSARPPAQGFPGSGAAAIRPVLIVRSKDQDRGEDNYELASGPTLIGRAPENDIILLEESVSRRHARIQIKGATCTVEDLGSANGSYLNGERLRPKEPKPLRDNDVLKLGQLLALFRLHPDD